MISEKNECKCNPGLGLHTSYLPAHQLLITYLQKFPSHLPPTSLIHPSVDAKRPQQSIVQSINYLTDHKEDIKCYFVLLDHMRTCV